MPTRFAGGSERFGLQAEPGPRNVTDSAQVSEVQPGLKPTDWKPFDDVGTGTKKIRVKDASGIFRVMYIAKFEEAIDVLHCFQMKTQATSQPDKAIAETRYRAVVECSKEKEMTIDTKIRHVTKP